MIGFHFMSNLCRNTFNSEDSHITCHCDLLCSRRMTQQILHTHRIERNRSDSSNCQIIQYLIHLLRQYHGWYTILILDRCISDHRTVVNEKSSILRQWWFTSPADRVADMLHLNIKPKMHKRCDRSSKLTENDEECV